MNKLLLLVGLVGVLAQGAVAAEVSGIKLDDEINFDGRKLLLNGAGVRTKYGFSVYVCGLYLTQRHDQTKDVLDTKGPKRVVVTMLREITSDDLGEALLSGIRKNSTQDETRRIGLQLVQLGQLFATIPRLKKGDTFSLDFAPEIGTTIMVNGKPTGDPLPDEAFFDAILRIWIGENPADSHLKPLMLGQKGDAPTSSGGGSAWQH